MRLLNAYGPPLHFSRATATPAQPPAAWTKDFTAIPGSFPAPVSAPGFVRPPATAAQVHASGAAAAAFLDDLLTREADFFAITRDPVSKLTFDGVNVDPVTGLATQVRHWSAASKEALDIGVVTKALEGNPIAVKVVGRGDLDAARRTSADILAGKLRSYEAFHRTNPGYGGMLPWFYSGKEITPTPEWTGRVPGLDNGEWAWTLLTAERALRRNGFTEIADGYGRYIDLLRSNVVKMFYDDAAGKIYGDVEILEPTSARSPYRAGATQTYLSGEHGVHEGAMMAHFVTLFGKDLPKDAAKRIWDGIQMKRVEHESGTTWQAYWGSSHESWAYLFLPMRDDPKYRDLFRIREEIRTNNAVARGYGGLATSTNDPASSGYLDGAGIEGIGSQPIRNNHSYAPYGAFPMLLEYSDRPAGSAGNPGLAWLANMLGSRHQYGPLGGGEAGLNDGSAAAYVKTIDGSFTNLLGLMGGLEHETADMLREHGKYDEFMATLRSEYDETFGDVPLREPVGFALPRVTL